MKKTVNKLLKVLLLGLFVVSCFGKETELKVLQPNIWIQGKNVPEAPVMDVDSDRQADTKDIFRIAGSTFYLSPSGDDKNAGTEEKPLASLSGARDKIRELRLKENIRDTIFVIIRDGVYYMNEPLVLSDEDSGTNASPVVFIAENGAHPVFYGGKIIDGFEKVSPALWRAYIPETALYGFYFEQLYINGERRFRAQTPNRGNFFTVRKVEETLLSSAKNNAREYASQKISVYEQDLSFLNHISPKEKSDALAVFSHNWDNTRKHIQYMNAEDTAFYTAGQGMKPWNPINKKSRYVIENYRKALDAPGEWFLQRDGYLYYIPLPGETPENITCIAPVAQQILKITGSENKPVQHIRFENLRFEITACLTPTDGKEPAQAEAPLDAAIMIDYARHVDFLNCDIAHTGAHGIWFRNQCSESKIEHCHLYDLGGGGVKIGTINLPSDEMTTNHITVHNSIIQHGGYVFPSAVGLIIFHGRDNEITHNDIADFRYSSISVGWVWGYNHSPSKRNRIEFNHLHHLGWGEMCDMGGVYTLGASEGTTVSNNVIHHIYSFDYGGWGLYTDEGSYGVLMENNLVYACKNSGFHQHYGKDNIIRNNIFALNLKSQLQMTRLEDHKSFAFTNNIIYFNGGQLLSLGNNVWLKAQVDMDYNCYWDVRTKTPDFHGLVFNDWKKLNRDAHSVIADPLFVNPEKFDFRFRNPSTVKKIKFIPFDYSQAGVYGSEEWINKSKLSPELERQFDERIKQMEM